MRYAVDEALCSGHGLCAARAGAVYQLDDDGFNRASGATVDVATGAETAARAGADACPDQAIRILEN